MTVKPNLLDRLTLAIAPVRGARRMGARLELDARQRVAEAMSRYYDAGRPSRATYGWLASFTDANSEIWTSLAALRARSRELERNNPYARKAINSLTSNCIGAGILPRAKTGNDALNKRINALFKEWYPHADAEGHFDYFGLQKLAVRSFFASGEGLIRKRVQPTQAGVPLQYQVLEGDFIDHNKNELTDDGRIIQGVELDRTGLRRNYWLFQEHPGEMPLTRRGQLASFPHPARNFLHLYEKERPGQQRGVPWLYAAMINLREFGTYREAELIRKRLEACFGAVIVNPEALADPSTGDVNVTPMITDLAGNKVEALEPGGFFYARGGSDIKFPQPTAMPGYSEYTRTELHGVAAGALMTYELLTGDLSRVNYSSIKAGQLDYRQMMDSLQWTTIIPVVCDRQWRDFIDFAVLAGKLPEGTPYGVAHSPPRLGSIDPLKDAMGDLIATRAGFVSTPEAISSRGYDPKEIAEEQAEYLKLCDDLGLVLDSDPRKTARSTGQSQPNAPAEEPIAPAEEGTGEDEGRAIYRAALGVLKRAGLNGSAEGIAQRIAAELRE
jgi:lambda family phage portal protein